MVANRFVTTEWSQVCTARDGGDSEARRALEHLCQIYWYPLYAFVRRQGHDTESAADLTQAYFTELMEKDILRSVEPSAGRFRSFLLASLKHFLSHERDRERALKRGGGTVTISLDAEVGEARIGAVASERLTPEEVFERQWAYTVLERVLQRLRVSAAEAGSAKQFDCLKGYLTGDATGVPYSQVAAELGMSEGAVGSAVYRLRRRFGSMLRTEIAATVADPADANDEIRHLLSVIQPWRGS
jgi:RNA polymerase sigma-70 factor (ECF subfamily)